MPKGPTLLFVALAFAAGVALGTLVGGPRTEAARTPARGEPADSRAPGDAAALAAPQAQALAQALEPTLVELRRAIAALTEGLARRPLAAMPVGEAPSPARVPVSDDGAASLDTAALAAAIARLAEAVQVLERTPRGGGASTGHGLVAPTWVDRDSAFANSGMRVAARVEDDGTTYETAEAVFQERHILWSVQDLLSIYGKPDSIEVNGDQAQWSYEIRFRGGEEYYHFYIHDETVIQTGYDWDFFE